MSHGGAFFGPQGVRALKAATVTMWVGFAALLAAAIIALALSQAWGWAALISAGIVGVLAVLVHANLRRHR